MKLNLGCGNDLRAGYLNIDIDMVFKPQEQSSEKFSQGNVASLEWVCDNGEVEEILALNILEFFPFYEIDDVLANWVDKLKPEGIIKLSVLDILNLCSSVSGYQVPMEQFISSVYGEQTDITNSRRSCIDANLLEGKLQKLGLRIITERLDNGMFYIEAQK